MPKTESALHPSIQFKDWEDLTFADDFMFHAVMKNKSICKDVVELLLNVKIDHVEFLNYEHTLSLSPQSKEIRLDVFLKDSDKIINVEMQTTNKPNLAKRARYYQAAADIDSTPPKTDYSKLYDNYVVFICTFDPFKCDFPVYTFENTCLESDNHFKLEDGTRKVFLNIATSRIDSLDAELKGFYYYIRTQKARTTLTKAVDERIIQVKSDIRQRRQYMTTYSRLLEQRQEGFEDGLQQGISQGSHQKAVETARILLTLGDTIEKISKATGLPQETILKLAN